MLPVELSGGAMCGHRTNIKITDAPAEVYLFRFVDDANKQVLAYQFANRTTRKGKRWVLQYVCIVSRSIGTMNTGEETP